MGLHQQFLSLIGVRPAEREVVAGLRDQIIELGTHVRFLEADRPVPQARDDAGRFVSKREILRQVLADAYAGLTDADRAAAIARATSPAVTTPLTDKQREQGRGGNA